jgi:hypothetical protein
MKFKQCYVSREVYRALELLAKAKFPTGDDVLIQNAIIEIADKIIRQVIKEKYPEILEYFRQRDKMEKEFLKQMRHDFKEP